MEERLGYDSSAAYEMAPQFPKGLRVRRREACTAELTKRIAREKRKTELQVYYYRIGHLLSFRLPVRQIEFGQMPEGIPKFASLQGYPWFTWFMWAMKERWDLLHSAWRRFGDQKAGRLLQEELAATAEWQNCHAEPGTAGLATGHLASCLAGCLHNPEGWDSELLRLAKQSALTLLDRDIVPFCRHLWRQEAAASSKTMHNINLIIQISGAHLAKEAGHEAAEELEREAEEIVRVWVRGRLSDERLSEGTAYDGFWLDPLADWLSAGGAYQLWGGELERTFLSFFDSCLHLALPGRLDISAPLGDTEPEMPFWMTVVAKLAQQYGWPQANWLIVRLPQERMPAAALDAIEGLLGADQTASDAPQPASKEHPFAISLRTGWDIGDCLVAVGAPRAPQGHLHVDGGHVVIGSFNRFWITDPGYQQYREGAERVFTIGAEAHNAPVVGYVAQSRRAAVVKRAATDEEGCQLVSLDLTGCYSGLHASNEVHRDVWLIPQEGNAVVVKDTIVTGANELPVRYYWQGGTLLSWAFVDGWARLGDGERALWVGAISGSPDAPLQEALEPARLYRHEGSRGMLTLNHVRTWRTGGESLWWFFRFDSPAGWMPPAAAEVRRLMDRSGGVAAPSA
ncbi:hypothetical protein [Paenibacillus sp. MBLB4367]|uniref:hypothetical protein n=1 Tax=Paenibacillus sp. MBLB4367 TaxID=3384767 RepID=UPI003907EB8E